MKEVKTLEEFQKLWRTENALVVDWYTDWCGPCKQMAPVLEKLEKEHKDVTFVRVNCDGKLRTLSDMMNVLSVPTVMFVRFGVLKRTSVGVVSESTLRRNIRDIRLTD